MPYVDKDGIPLPLVPSRVFPGEQTLACRACGSTDITLTILPGAFGTAPGGRWRMGDEGGREIARCESCKAIATLG